MMKKILIIIFLLNFYFSNDLLKQFPPSHYNLWKELKKGTIKVEYSDHFSIPWCRASTNLAFSTDDIYGALKNLKNYKNIFDRVTDSRVLDENIVYIRLDMPYFFSDRDYTVSRIKT